MIDQRTLDSIYAVKGMNGYTFQTTFWQDFSIAEMYGNSSIQDTYNRVFKAWKTNHIYLTELVMVLNWKCWEAYEQGRELRSQLYEKLYYQTRGYACDHLQGEKLEYFYKTTD